MSFKVIGAMGDSITQGYWDEEGLGWFGRLSQKIAKEYPLDYGFLNMSKSGDTTVDFFHRFGSEVTTRTVDIAILAIGINDLIRAPFPDSQTYMSEAFRVKYWDKLLSLAQKHCPQIIVLDILPVDEDSNFVEGEALYSYNKDVEEYNAVIKKMCKDRGIKFFERHPNWAKRNLKELYLDGVHPNGVGHKIIADEVFEELKRIKFI